MATRAVGRLRGRALFQALRHTPHVAVRGPIRVAFVQPCGDGPFPLIGYAVGRRCGRAVQRNRLRRRIRSAAIAAVPQLAPGAYLVSSGPEASAFGYPELAMAVRAALLAACAAAKGDR